MEGACLSPPWHDTVREMLWVNCWELSTLAQFYLPVSSHTLPLYLTWSLCLQEGVKC